MVLQNKVALITGGSRGIGKGIAIALAGAGADIAINFLGDQHEAEETAEQIRQLGRRAALYPVDVARQADVEKMVADVVNEFGHLDIAVTNAVYSDREPFVSANMEGFHRTVDVTMWGAFYVLRASAQQMIRQGAGGSIVVVSSPHSYIPIPTSMAYNMAKAAIDQMARTAALELVDQRIRVNMIHPGWIDTPGERKYASEQKIATVGKQLPWGRLGRPDEIGRAALYLCDPASEYMTGSSMLVDGGSTLPWWAKGGMGVPD
ncbi:MAG: SDR family oxidoreductase [Planctomycetota bacterium]|nr:SDR family oxidoreductase [Planctomycetota bacterium]